MSGNFTIPFSMQHGEYVASSPGSTLENGEGVWGRGKESTGEYGDLSVYFTESPGPPSDLRLLNVTNTSALLSWSPPDNGGGRPLSEIFYTVTATGELLLFFFYLSSTVCSA